jgi:hypothetical protein
MGAGEVLMDGLRRTWRPVIAATLFLGGAGVVEGDEVRCSDFEHFSCCKPISIGDLHRRCHTPLQPI